MSVFFSWKKNQGKISAPPNKQRWLKAESELVQSLPENPEILIRFEHVSLSPVIRNLSVEIKNGSWLFLQGPEDFAKALFCDLCFGYIQPEHGKVQPALRGSDVSFLGRSNTTYGNSLIAHLSCGIQERSRENMEYVVQEVFSKEMKALLSKDSSLILKENKKVSDLDLQEKDYLEIAEANLLLQRRPAVIIDTTSDFYRTAYSQGFRHSNLLLNSGKTIFWIVDELVPLAKEDAPWNTKSKVLKSNLYFSHEFQTNHIN